VNPEKCEEIMNSAPQGPQGEPFLFNKPLDYEIKKENEYKDRYGDYR
jgi:hypothetical protein